MNCNGTSVYYDCEGVLMFGGRAIAGSGSTLEKVFTDLPIRPQVNVSFSYFAGATWDVGEYMRFFVDQVQKWQEEGHHPDSSDYGCHTTSSRHGYRTKVFSATVTLETYSPSTLTLTWGSTLNDVFVDEWFGIKDVSLVFSDCYELSCKDCSGPEVEDCSSCYSGYHFEGSRCMATCTAQEYRDPDTNTCKGKDP